MRYWSSQALAMRCKRDHDFLCHPQPTLPPLDAL
jgi:hypothetical protein